MKTTASAAPEPLSGEYKQRTRGRRADTIPLTDENIRGALPVTKRTFLWDSTVPGFGVDINPPDRVSYVVRGQCNGMERRVVLKNAPWPHGTYKPKDARNAAKMVLAQWAMGRDPYAKPVAPPKVTTLRMAAAAYCEELRVHARETTIRSVQRIFCGIEFKGKTHYTFDCILPLLDQDIMTITREQVRALHASIYNEVRERTESPTKQRGGRRADEVITMMLKAIFNHHVRDMDPVPPNPAKAINKRTTFAHRLGVGQNDPRPATPEELDRLIAALNTADIGSPEQRAACFLQLLCGWRISRAQELRWEWVSADAIMVPSSTNRKTKKSFKLPLTPQLRQLLEHCRSFGSDEWVTPSSRGQVAINCDTPWLRWFAAAAVPNFTSHNVRDTVSTWVSQLAGNPMAGDVVIDHVQGSQMQRRYQGFDAWKMRWLSDYHDELVKRGLVIPGR